MLTPPPDAVISTARECELNQQASIRWTLSQAVLSATSAEPLHRRPGPWSFAPGAN